MGNKLERSALCGETGEGLEMEIRWLVFEGWLVSFRCSSKVPYSGISWNMNLRVSWNFICIAAREKLIKTWNKPVVPGTSHVCSDFSWECSWQCQFTNNTPTGSCHKPSDKSWILAFWHNAGANNFISNSLLKILKKDQTITELKHLLKKRGCPPPGLWTITHWHSLLSWLPFFPKIWVKNVPEAAALWSHLLLKWSRPRQGRAWIRLHDPLLSSCSPSSAWLSSPAPSIVLWSHQMWTRWTQECSPTCRLYL